VLAALARIEARLEEVEAHGLPELCWNGMLRGRL
jgi:hypothetical protein